MNDSILGYIGALIAAVFFGSNYVPTKNYPNGDGFMFVWAFSSGVLVVGILSTFQVTQPEFHFSGLLGGSLWAAGNLCVIPIVKTIGLGLGMLLWGAVSLLTGFLVGKIGLFGLIKSSVSHTVMNWIGIGFIILALFVFFFIEPSLERDEYTRIDEPETRSIQAPPKAEVSVFERIPPAMRSFVGISLAVLSGVLYGLNTVPMALWVQKQKAIGNSPGPLDFVLSHFIGIYLFSTVVFTIYCIFKRAARGTSPQVFAESVFPAMISGAMWGIAQCGLMIAIQINGYAVGFPIGSAGPLIVSSLWSVIYFREIRGQRNLFILGVSFILLFVGIGLLALSNFSHL